MAEFPQTFGALLIGTWVNAGLYTFELTQIVYLFKNYKDPLPIRAAALSAFAVDSLCTASSFAAIYHYCITHWGDLAALATQPTPIPLYVYSTGITAFIVQLFLIYRVHILSKNIPVIGVLLFMALVSFGSSMITATWLVRFPTYAQRDTLMVPATTWFVSSAAADIAVAIVLVWQLQRVKTGFRSTKGIVRRLSATALRSGSATASIATITLILYLIDNQSNIAVGFAFCMGRVYSLTMFYNLNTRKSGKISGGATSHTHTTGDLRSTTINFSTIQNKRNAQGAPAESPSQVDVTTEATHIDHKIAHDDEMYDARVAPYAHV